MVTFDALSNVIFRIFLEHGEVRFLPHRQSFRRTLYISEALQNIRAVQVTLMSDFSQVIL